MSAQVHLRCDPKYRFLWDIQGGRVLPSYKGQEARLRSVILPFSETIIHKGALDESRTLIELADVQSKTSIVLQERNVDEVGSDKLEFDDCDIVINQLEPYLGKILINDRAKRWIGTTEWVPLKLDHSQIHPAFLRYLLLTDNNLEVFRWLKAGKRHARFNYRDLLNLSIPLPPIDRQKVIVAKIKPTEDRLRDLTLSLPSAVQVINEVFAVEFDYSADKYKKLSRDSFTLSLSDLGRSPTLRAKVKYHHPRYKYLESILDTSTAHIRLKRLLAEDIHRGVQPDYAEDGEVLVIKTLNLKHERLDFEESEHVTNTFWEANPQAQVLSGDILISSTGEGRGKVDIYLDSEPALADSHISIVHLLPEVNREYVLYYLRSLLGKGQLDTAEIAVKGTPELYWYQLHEIRLAWPAPKVQERLIKTVRAKLDALANQRREIADLRNEIDSKFLALLAGK